MLDHWDQDFAQRLCSVLAHKKIVLLGIGQVGQGDDAFGPLLAEAVGTRGDITSITCAELPENYTEEITRLSPEVVLLLDAVDFNGQAGELVLLKEEDYGSDYFSAHHASLQPFMRYLALVTGADVRLLGVQPASLAPETGLSRQVKETFTALQSLLGQGFSETDEDEP